MASIDQLLADWQLIPDGEAFETPSSHLLPVKQGNRQLMLKIMKPQSDEKASIELLKYFDGIGAVRLENHTPDALLLERGQPVPSLEQMVLEGRDDEASLIIADTVQKIHQPRAHPYSAALMPLERRFASLFKMASKGPDIYAHTARIARQLLDTAPPPVPLHGDIHHGNILQVPGRGWLAIDPKGLLGDPVYDLANTLCNPLPHTALIEKPARMHQQASIISQRLGFSTRRLLEYAFVHGSLWACWSLEDGGDDVHGLACAKTAQELLAD